MKCPKCSGNLKLLLTDSRQEWVEESYFCERCRKSFLRRVEFQTQSELSANDTLKEIKD